MIEVLSHPLVLIGGGYCLCYAGAWTIDKVNERSVMKKQVEQSEPLEELELWHYLWMSPSISDTFYEWDGVNACFKEREPWEVVGKILRWFDRSESVRSQFSVEIGHKYVSFWSKKMVPLVMDYGLWNAVERLDELTKKEAEKVRQRPSQQAFFRATMSRDGYYRYGTFERPVCNGTNHIWENVPEGGSACQCGKKQPPGVDRRMRDVSPLIRRLSRLMLDYQRTNDKLMRKALDKRIKELQEKIERDIW